MQQICQCLQNHLGHEQEQNEDDHKFLEQFKDGILAVLVVLPEGKLPWKSWSLLFLDVREANALVVCCARGSKVTVIEVDGKALMLSGKLSLSRRAINGGTRGHPCVAW